MKHTLVARSLGLALSLGLVVAGAAVATDRREVTESFALDGAAEVLVEVEIGELTVEASDGDLVEVELDLRCRSSSPACERQLERIDILEERRSERLRVHFDGITKSTSRRIEVEVTVRVPRVAQVGVDMAIGEVDITGVERDVFVDRGIGEVRLWLLRDSVGSVYLDAGIGEAALYGAESSAESSRPFLVGSELEWEAGDGEAEIVVDLGIGEISVHLD
jgi:hypothetical protein